MNTERYKGSKKYGIDTGSEISHSFHLNLLNQNNGVTGEAILQLILMLLYTLLFTF